MTKALTIAVLAFGLAYACLWWSFQRFYAPFGVSPQDVGLAPSGTSADLPGAALQLGIWLIIGLTIMAVLPTLCVLALEMAKDSKTSSIPAVAIAIVLAAATVGIYWWLVDHWKGVITIGVAAAGFAVVQYGLKPTARTLKLVPSETTVRQPSPDAQAGAKLDGTTEALGERGGLRGWLGRLGADEDLAPRLTLAFGIFLAAAVVGLAFLDLPTDAAEAGNCVVKDGKSVPSLNIPLPRLHLPILSVHAQPATLTWLITSPPSDIDNSHVVYLGQTGGSIVVYDLTNKRTNRIPSGMATVNIDPTTKKCPGVH
jgi:hypothetical protein